MRNFYKIFILVILLSSGTICQVRNHPFSGRFNLSLDGGFTVTKSDYQESQTGLIIQGGLEYFFPTTSASSFGLRFSGGGLTAKGKDDRRIVSSFSTDINNIGLGAIYSYSISNNVFPYIYAGISNIWFNPKTSEGRRAPNNAKDAYDKSAISYNLELGLRIPVSGNFIIKVASDIHFFNTDLIDDISPEHVLDFPAGPNNDFLASGIIGISYAFSGSNDQDGDGVEDKLDMCPNTPQGIIIDEYGCPLDSDNDGVPDYLDKCPATGKNEKVDKNGCPLDSDKDGISDGKDECPETPAGILVDDKGCPLDSDNDGVPDYLDKCSGTAAGKSVDANGCPNDSDMDGVIDSLDNCPNTPAGTQVDEYGCPIKTEETSKKQVETKTKEIPAKVNTIPDVKPENTKKPEPKQPAVSPGTNKIVLQSDEIFIQGTTTINSSAYGKLNGIIDFLRKDPWTKWKVIGYVDSQVPENVKGSTSYEKANSIVNYFIENGLPSFQFQVYGLGDESPVASNNTSEGRSKNRRIEIVKINK